jgi:hypothetical protein
LLPPPSAAPLRSYPTDSSVRDIVTERRLIGASRVDYSEVSGTKPTRFAWQNNYCTKSVKPVAEVVEPLEAVTTTR